MQDRLTAILIRVSCGIIIFFGFGYLLQIAAPIIIPFIFAIFLSIFLNPLHKRLLKYVKFRWISIVLSYLILLLPLAGILTLFSFQIVSIASSLPSIEDKIFDGAQKVLHSINTIIPMYELNEEDIIATGEKNINQSLRFLSNSLLSTTTFIFSMGMTFLYAFFLMYYRKNFKQFIKHQFNPENRKYVKGNLRKIKSTIQSYISGVGIVIIVLSILNSIGLSIIGVDFAIFWGVLAGCLSIIPYFGTAIGGLLPVLYCISTCDTLLPAIYVGFFYMAVQQLEGNIITPKIVGSKVDINPLFAILAIVIFGTFWGVAGIILSLPLISILKIILSNFDGTHSISVLMSASMGNKEDVFTDDKVSG